MATTISFDDLPAGTSVSNQYDARGVDFQRGIVGSNVYCYPVIRQVAAQDAQSGDRVAEISCTNGEFPDSAVRGTLKNATQTVSVYGGYFSDPNNPGASAQMTLNAYDASGGLVGSNSETVSEGQGFHTLLEVSSPSANIVAFDVSSSSPHLGIDNLTFGAPPPKCVRVSTRQELVGALAAGSRCVYVEDNAQIDLALGDNRPGTPDYEIHVPDGVTLESGRSPTDPGGLLYMSHALQTQKVMLDLGANTHVTGLRLGGFDASGNSPEDPTTGIRIAGVDGVLVANDDIYGWPGSGVDVESAPNDQASAGRIRITGSFIHNNEGRGLGYGVSVGGSGYALIDRDVFSYNRHDVAGGHSSPTAGYIAQLNFILQPGYVDPTCGHFGCYGGHFDFHGSDDPGHWVGGAAGQHIEIQSNTIRGDQRHHWWQSRRPAFDIRGTPTDRAIFANNVVVHPDEDAAVAVSGVCGHFCDDKGKLKEEHKLFIRGNSWHVLTEAELAVGNFAADGCADVFQANGTAWWYSPCGSGVWRFLRASTLRLNQLALGDFNGDGKSDVFTQSGDSWLVSYGGTGPWQALPSGSSVPMKNYRFGDFDGDGSTDIFRTERHQWYYSRGGRTAWLPLQTSSLTIDQLRFGDFDGDGTTDVFSLANHQWSVSYGGTSPWQRLNKQISSNLGELVFADFNGDHKTDIARSHDGKWQVSWGGATPWQPLQTRSEPSLTGMLLADFNGDGHADALQYHGLNLYKLSSAGAGPLMTWSQQDML